MILRQRGKADASITPTPAAGIAGKIRSLYSISGNVACQAVRA
jgi:hypothetical protein